MKRTPRILTAEQRENLMRQARAASATWRALWESRVPPPPDEGAILVVLLGCVKEKATERMPAHELYGGQLWTARWAYAQRVAPQRTLILSAAWGLLHPDEVIAPYDVTLREKRMADRQAWASRVASRLHAFGYGPPERMVVEVHAGADYREFLVSLLESYGMTVTVPLAHMGIGQQKAWYGAQAAAK